MRGGVEKLRRQVLYEHLDPAIIQYFCKAQVKMVLYLVCIGRYILPVMEKNEETRRSFIKPEVSMLFSSAMK